MMPDHALITADVYSITPSTNKVGIYLLYFTFCAAAAAELLRSCPSLGYTLDCSLPGSSVRGILQAIIPEWVPCLPPGDLPKPGIGPATLTSPVLAGEFFTTSATWALKVTDQSLRY